MDEINEQMQVLFKHISERRLSGTEQLLTDALTTLHNGLNTLQEMIKSNDNRIESSLTDQLNQILQTQQTFNIANDELKGHLEVLTEFSQNFFILNGIMLGVSHCIQSVFCCI